MTTEGPLHKNSSCYLKAMRCGQTFDCVLTKTTHYPRLTKEEVMQLAKIYSLKVFTPASDEDSILAVSGQKK